VINSNWHPSFQSYRSLLVKFWTLCVGEGLGTTYNVHLGRIVKRVVKFLLVLIELFSLGVTAESIYKRKDIENRRFRSNAVTLIQNFR